MFFYSLSLHEFIPGCTYTALLPGSVCLLDFFSLPSMLAHLTFCRGWFKIGKISTFFQPKALIPASKNQIFQKFLTYFPKTSYERRATKNGYIFVSKVQVALIIEGVFFYSLSLPPVGAYLLFCRGLLFSPPAKSSQLFTCL